MKKLIPILGIWWLLERQWLDEVSESFFGNVITIVLFLYHIGMFLVIMSGIIIFIEVFSIKALIFSLLGMIIVCSLVIWLKYVPGRRKEKRFTTYLTRQLRP